LIVGPAVFDFDVLALGIADFIQALAECINQILGVVSREFFGLLSRRKLIATCKDYRPTAPLIRSRGGRPYHWQLLRICPPIRGIPF
jgi:hypothetical protein